MNLSKIIIILFSTFLFGQNNSIGLNPWNHISVATSDKLNAITGNPAGLGVNRGDMVGAYVDKKNDTPSSISLRSEGIGFDLTYYDYSKNLFNPADGNISFGSAIFRNFYAGFKWNKHKLIDLGLLFRPINQLSIGATVQLNDNDKLIDIIKDT